MSDEQRIRELQAAYHRMLRENNPTAHKLRKEADALKKKIANQQKAWWKLW